MNPLVRYVPPAVNISNISNSSPAVVTTTTPHGYQSGINIRIVIPYPHVMPELNEQDFIGFVLSPTQIILAYDDFYGTYANGTNNVSVVDTTNSTPWSAGPNILVTPPPPSAPFFVPAQIAQVVPIGEQSITLKNASDVIGPRNLP